MSQDNDRRVVNGVNYGDIEGVWTFAYFSCNTKLKSAVGFLRFDGSNQYERLEFRNVVHRVLEKEGVFVIGGKDVIFS